VTESLLTVLTPGAAASDRFARTLEYALAGRRAAVLTRLPEGPLPSRRVLFAVPLDRTGCNPELYALLSALRDRPGALEGCTGGIYIDGPGDLYTKSAARELALAANGAGCRFPGRALAEATGELRNFTVQARNAGLGLEEACRAAVRELAGRILAFEPPRRAVPEVVVLHASSRATSNTLDLWGMVRRELGDACAVREICLRNGTLEDCAGCPYTTCLHFGEKGGCFYGGVMVQEVYPAVRQADALVLLCPNYNDALSANLTAFINRLSALYRTTSFSDKALFALVVSGYSGGDIVASQLLSALSMNKGFWLPERFALLETANDAGEARRLPGIGDRTAAFAARIRAQICL
jgi:multimeric flavodoxin WrbA